jgi:adenosine deaminase/adenosine deaminase CECR1
LLRYAGTRIILAFKRHDHSSSVSKGAFMPRLAPLLTAALAFGPLAVPLCQAAPPDTARTAAWFSAHKERPPMLRQFLQRMPKGADLHSHISGAVYAESYLKWAAEANFCVDTDKLAFVPPPCTETGTQQLAAKLPTGTYSALVDRMSTRNLAYAGRSGHDQFFDTFGVFGPVSGIPDRFVSMVAELADRAAAQHILYLELMTTFQSGAVRKLGSSLPWATESDFARRRQWLLDNGLIKLVEAGQKDLDTLDAAYDQTQACATNGHGLAAAPDDESLRHARSPSPPRPSPASGRGERSEALRDFAGKAKPGCSVTVRWQQQTSRTGPPEQVFAQLAYAFELAKADKRVVGINLVAPEDDPVALRDYPLQMEMVGFLSKLAPEVRIALHAGELALGLVPPDRLRNHIRDAVRVAGAQRIGHAVDIGYEDGAAETLKTMREKGVAAEICLTSNDVILGVKGKDHPFPDYLAAGVPVVLASDDEGVSRIDLSNEYLRAAQGYGLSYRQLKQLSRNSLEYSFLPGGSLWQSADRLIAACRGDTPGASKPSATCQAYLAGSEKASRQWALEAEYEAFEKLPEWKKVGH